MVARILWPESFFWLSALGQCGPRIARHRGYHRCFKPVRNHVNPQFARFEIGGTAKKDRLPLHTHTRKEISYVIHYRCSSTGTVFDWRPAIKPTTYGVPRN